MESFNIKIQFPQKTNLAPVEYTAHDINGVNLLTGMLGINPIKYADLLANSGTATVKTHFGDVITITKNIVQ